MFNVEILADSLSPQGDRLTTMKITFPRIILAEFNTHRMFSRNSASSRAIPFEKMVKSVEENPFIPIAWQKDHKGMQGTEYITDKNDIWLAKANWLRARDYAVDYAKHNNEQIGVTKQLCNRLLEPFMWHTVIVTSGKEGLENFFNLRCPSYLDKYKSWKDACVVNGSLDFKASILEKLSNNKSQADIHIQAVAELMWDKINSSTPKQLKSGEWHIPNLGHEWDIHKLKSLLRSGKYNDENEITPDIEILKIKISVAHCARISYTTLGNNPKIDYEADLKLHDILAQSGHWSPFEHVAKAMDYEEYYAFRNGKLSINNKGVLYDDETDKNTFGWCRNFRGFIQYRHLIDN
jgi:thymidylate synthase ThyX